MTWHEYEKEADSRLLALHEHLHRGTYRSHPARRVTERLAKFGLNIHPKKTQLIQFGRFTQRDRKQVGLGKPATFDFIGFTFYCNVTRKQGWFTVGRKTIKKQLLKTLREFNRELRKRLHEPIGKTGKWLERVLLGHMNYCAVPGNLRSIQCFFIRVRRMWLRSLRRRGQRSRMAWSRFAGIWNRVAPAIRLKRGYPEQRFDATT